MSSAAGSGPKAAAANTSHAFAAFEAKGAVKAFDYPLRALGPADIQVAVTHCGICHSDVHAIDNDWRISAYPHVPGHEIVGVVVAAGPKAAHRVGTRVGVSPAVGCCDRCADCRAGEEQYCAKGVPVSGVNRFTTPPTPMYGGFSSHLVVDSKWAFELPAALPSETAAPLLCAGITVWSPLQRWAKAGQRVGVVGIGGLGHLALQFASAMGCTAVALTTSADKAKAARGFGAADVVVSTSADDMKRARKSLDVLLVTINADAKWDAYLGLLKTNGVLCLVGIPDRAVKVSPMLLTLRRLTVCGSLTGSRAEIQQMLAFAARHRVVAQTERFDMSEPGIAAALTKVRANTIRYRAVLRAKL